MLLCFVILIKYLYRKIKLFIILYYIILIEYLIGIISLNIYQTLFYLIIFGHDYNIHKNYCNIFIVIFYLN